LTTYQVTIRDTVALHQRLTREVLGVNRFSAVVGGSLGGMQTVEWAFAGPDFVKSIVPLACGADHSPWQIAFGETQRQAIYADAKWRGGFHEGMVIYGGLFVQHCDVASPGENSLVLFFSGGDYPPNDPPAAGLSVARQFAMISYRTASAYRQKFGRERVSTPESINRGERKRERETFRRKKIHASHNSRVRLLPLHYN
jgi:homoserine O-acetyltransferase